MKNMKAIEPTKDTIYLLDSIDSQYYFIHGMKDTRIYNTWEQMRKRCKCKTNKAYPLYGGRGIKVCDLWDDSRTGFITFLSWSLQNGYNDTLTIDRIDPNGNYEPSNCRWTDYKTQLNNTRRNRYIEYNGKVQTLAQWAEEYNMNRKTLTSRLNAGWSMERALTEPIHYDCYRKQGTPEPM